MRIDQFAELINAANAGVAAGRHEDPVDIKILVDEELYDITGTDYDTDNNCFVIKVV